MTPDQITTVQSTWRKVVPIADAATGLFYDKLLDLDPSLRSMFPEDLTEQKRKLMAMIGRAVSGLNQLDDLVPAVQDLGMRHASYGVLEPHYATVAAALLWTLEQGLGDAWNDEVKAACVDRDLHRARYNNA
jgi:hemoglobin-like flavoprotein